jgi:GTP1/Obg family GTP-binding protein
MNDDKRDELNRIVGASDMISLLLEEMEQWLEEAQDESKQETLENVVGHLGSMQEEYRQRLAALQKAMAET